MEREEREPSFLKGTNTEFFGWFLGILKEDTERKNVTTLWGMHLPSPRKLRLM